MTSQEIIKLLNQNNNFHLSMRCIMASDVKILYFLKDKLGFLNKKTVIIEKLENSYEELLKAYQTKTDYVLVSKELLFMLPIINIITTDDTQIIKPIIPTYYCLKDNKIIQKVKTTCNKKMSKYTAFHSIEELIEEVIKFIK